jgi:hypothetical protein
MKNERNWTTAPWRISGRRVASKAAYTFINDFLSTPLFCHKRADRHYGNSLNY